MAETSRRLLQGLNSIQSPSRFHFLPVGVIHESPLLLPAVGDRRTPDQGTRRPRPDVTRDDFPIEAALGLLALMLRVEMRRLVLPIEHPNDDCEERRDDRHALSRLR